MLRNSAGRMLDSNEHEYDAIKTESCVILRAKEGSWPKCTEAAKKLA